MRVAAAFFILLLIAGVFIWGVTVFMAACNQRKEQIMSEESKPISAAEVNDVNDLTITVVYDNNPYQEGLATAWGFACLITGAEKTILFDTGGDGAILLDNMGKLAIEPNSIDVVVLSHIHGDHTGGLGRFLGTNPHMTVYLPKSFPERIKGAVGKAGAKIAEVEGPIEICENVFSTGQLGMMIREQSLVVRTKKGLLVITGCAHPGIVKIVRTARNLLKDDVVLVMGGFHLEWATKGKLEKIISAFEELGVCYVGPCHCTGEKAKSLFQAHFGRNYIEVGAGKVMTLADLQ